MKLSLVTIHAYETPQAIPLAAASLAANLNRSLRVDASLIDLYLAGSPEDHLCTILNSSPDIVSFSLYLWNRESIVALIEQLSSVKPELKIIVGGPEVTADPAGIRREIPHAICVLGEGEGPFRIALDTLVSGGSRQSQNGLIWPGHELNLSVAVADMNALVSPWISGVLPLTPGGGVLWEVARGCHYNCDYCFDGRGTKGVRSFPVDRLRAELELFRAADVHHVWVLDSSFNADPEHAIMLLELIRDHGGEAIYHFEGIAEQVNEKIARLLTSIPASVQIGLQSADRKVLKTLHRAYDPERFAHGINLLNIEGIPFGLDLIYGLPGDSLSGFTKSLDIAIAFQPNHLDIFPLVILNGTRIADRVEEFSILFEEGGAHRVISHPTYSEQDMEKSRKLAESVSILYNKGKSVGYFLRFCDALKMQPVELLHAFTQWREDQNISDSDRLTDAETYQICSDFYGTVFGKKGPNQQLRLAKDTLLYHYHYTDTMLGEPLTPSPQPVDDQLLLKQRWVFAKNAHLVDFSYEILDILAAEELPMKQFTKEFRQTGSTALFFRTESEVFCESVEDEFLQLLRKSDGTKSVREILPMMTPNEQIELLRFAVEEGILIPPS